MCLITHIHTGTAMCTYTHTHTDADTHTHTLQQWEERATVTNSSGATKVAGNLSNGTIKQQLSFFSFFFFLQQMHVSRWPQCNAALLGFAAPRVRVTFHKCTGLFTHCAHVQFCREASVVCCYQNRAETPLILCNYCKKNKCDYGVQRGINSRQDAWPPRTMRPQHTGAVAHR